MIDIESLVTLCRTALAGGSKVLEAYKRKRFSSEERAIMIAAASDGKFHLLSVGQIPGTWVRAGGKDFMDESDPAVAALHLEAFRSLCERGLIVHEGGKLFMLTGTGFTKAREFRKDIDVD